MIYFDISEPWKKVKHKINSAKHSCYLVCENHNIDEVVGIVLLKDLFDVDDKTFSLKDYITQPVYINEFFQLIICWNNLKSTECIMEL